jgi:transposase
MFFREKKSKQSKNPTLQLVENQRVGKKFKQRVVISLGVGFEVAPELRRQVANVVEQKLLGQQALFNDARVIQLAERIVKKIQTEGRWTSVSKAMAAAPKNLPEQVSEVAEVYVDQVEHGNDRILGPLLIGHTFWNRLGFPAILRQCNFNNQQIQTAELSILNRLIAQNSEHAIPDWIKTVAAEDLIHKSAEEFADDRFYNISDQLLSHQATIEKQLYENEKSLFNLNNCIYLYDLTNTYFEGLCAGNPKAEFNKNQKEKRTDCRQIVIALVLDQEGFVRRHYIFKGKTADASSLEDMLRLLESDFQGAHLPTIIMDRGIATDDNIKLLESKGLNYIVATRSGEEKPFIDDFINADFKVIKNKKNNSVEIFLKRQGDQTYLLCRSEARQLKEKAMRNQAEMRLEEDLNKLKALIDTGKRTEPLTVERAIGRIKERHSRASHYYTIEFTPFSFAFQIPDGCEVARRLENSLKKLKEKADKYKISHIKLNSKLKELSGKYPEDYLKVRIQVTEPEFSGKPIDEKRDQLKSLDGNYLLKTNRKDLNDAEIWRMYVMLTRVEAAFRNLKTDLKLRPNFHQKKERVDGHVFITILAYHLLHSIECTLRANSCTSSWATVKRLVSTHTYSTIILPTTSGKVIHLRKPGQPEPIHQEIYKFLKVDVNELKTQKIQISKK